MLLAGTAACASNGSRAAGTPEVSAAPSETGEALPSTAVPSTSAAPAEPFTDEQIKSLYNDNDLSVLEIRDAGAYTMVHYYSLEVPDDKVSRFDWFDRKTGERELVYGWVYADKFEITANKTLTVLTTGVSPTDGGQSFPDLFTWSSGNVDGAANPSGATLAYYMPLEQSFTVGADRPECLTSVCFDSGSMLLTFGERPGYETAFHGAAETIPQINVTNRDGVSTITIYNTILSDNFIQTAGRLLGSEPSPVTVNCDGTDTVITFRMSPNAGRYNISSFSTPVDYIPRAVITYTSSEYSYPKGW
jgi:hypothetical protein